MERDKLKEARERLARFWHRVERPVAVLFIAAIVALAWAAFVLTNNALEGRVPARPSGVQASETPEPRLALDDTDVNLPCWIDPLHDGDTRFSLTEAVPTLDLSAGDRIALKRSVSSVRVFVNRRERDLPPSAAADLFRRSCSQVDLKITDPVTAHRTPAGAVRGSGDDEAGKIRLRTYVSVTRAFRDDASGRTLWELATPEPVFVDPERDLAKKYLIRPPLDDWVDSPRDRLIRTCNELVPTNGATVPADSRIYALPYKAGDDGAFGTGDDPTDVLEYPADEDGVYPHTETTAQAVNDARCR